MMTIPRSDVRNPVPGLVRMLLIVAAVFLAPAAAPAQATPAQTVQALFDAMAARQWDSAAALFTLPSAAWYQRHQLGLEPPPAGDDESAPLQLWLPDPESVTREDSIWLGLIPGLGHAAELSALPPPRFVALVLGIWGTSLDFEIATAPGARKVIGQVVENDSVAHVLYRVELGPYPDGFPSAIRVVRLDAVDGRWLVRVNRELFRSYGGVRELYDAWKNEQEPVPNPPRAVRATAFTRDGGVAGTAGGTAVILRGDSVEWIGTRVGGDRSKVHAASAAGAITGVLAENQEWHPYAVLADGAVHRLPEGFIPAAVNDSGQVAGLWWNGTDATRGAIWQAGKPLLVLQPEPAYPAFLPSGINNLGEVVGSVEDRSLAAVWSGGRVRELNFEAQAEGVGIHRRGVSINDRGEVIGSRNGHPVVWSQNRVVELPLPAGATGGRARAINNLGQVVGSATAEERVPDRGPLTQAVLWENGAVRVLRPPQGALDCAAHAINDAGAVLGACLIIPHRAAGGGDAVPFEVFLIWENGVARPLCTAFGPGSSDMDPRACDPASYAEILRGPARDGEDPVALPTSPE